MQYKRGYKNETGVMLRTQLFKIYIVLILDIFGGIGYAVIVRLIIGDVINIVHNGM